jgi:hypothetical protein
VTHDQIATYRAALKEARASFDQATKRLEEIQSEALDLKNDADRLRRTITALAAMCSEDPLIDRLGITDSCLEIMEVRKTAATTGDVVEALEQRGFDLASQKNAPASVHAILSRLAHKGKIQKFDTNVVGNSGRTMVMWKGPNFDPSATLDDEDIPF